MWIFRELRMAQTGIIDRFLRIIDTTTGACLRSGTGAKLGQVVRRIRTSVRDLLLLLLLLFLLLLEDVFGGKLGGMGRATIGRS